MAKFIKQDRKPLDPLGGQEFGTPELIKWALESDGRFNTTGLGIKASLRIEQALDRCKGKVWLKIEQDNDYALLQAAIDNPSPQPFPNGAPRPAYPISPAKKLAAFIDDILKPMDDEPEVVDEAKSA